MKTVWSGGDIITAEKLNNIEENSLNNLMICLNTYQDQEDSSILNITLNEINKLISHKAFLYFYYNGIVYYTIFNNYNFHIDLDGRSAYWFDMRGRNSILIEYYSPTAVKISGGEGGFS